MIVNVELWAFGEGEVREVEVPDSQWNNTAWTEGVDDKDGISRLELVFWHGQNDNQPRDQPSVSMGDVAVLPNGERWLCLSVGWKQLSDVEYADHKQLERLERSFNAMRMGI